MTFDRVLLTPTDGHIVRHYKPAGKTLEAFRRSDAFVRGIMGPWGSGKTSACCSELIRRARKQRKSPDGKRKTRWAIIRNTYGELLTTTLKTWFYWMPKEAGRWNGKAPFTHHIQSGDLDMEVVFIALDREEDVKKLLSLELTGAYINEASEVPEAILRDLTGRVMRYPNQNEGGQTWRGIIMDTNPPDTTNYWYRLAEEETPEGYEFFRQPAGDGPDAENLANLDRDYYQIMSRGKSPEWIKKYIKGEYGFMASGQPVWPQYIDSLHCSQTVINPRLPIYFGCDFGRTPAAVFGQRTIVGNWSILSEIVTQNMGAIEFAKILLLEMRGRYSGFKFEGWGDPAGENPNDVNDDTPIKILNAAGIPIRSAPTNNPTLRVEAVSSVLSGLIDGKPQIIIDPACSYLRKGMLGGFGYKQLRVSGSNQLKPKPEKNIFSHVCEALEYMFIGAGEGATIIRRPDDGLPRQIEAADDQNPRGGFSAGRAQTQAIED